MKINKIYHVADIHIRNLQRHKEYRKVFNQFLDNVKSDNIKDSVIYIGGDIAHAKTEMSPELVSQISWFLSECAKLRETIVITGNHDCNLNNSHRLDVLTPIVENLNNPRIHYLRDTGVYNIHNLTFVVYSILDNRENWPKAKDVDGDTKICLFHGPVNKSKTDIGYVVSSNSFTVDMFDGFDMVLMGDIHKRQVVQELDSSSNKPIVSYCGSLIQQNHGELLDNHGYLLWDVETRTFREFNIKNEYGFVTIDIVDGKIPKWVYDEIDTKLPKYPRLRVRFNNTSPSDMKLRIADLKKLFKVHEVTVTRTDTIGQLKNNGNINKNIVGNVRDETFQNSLIREYLIKNSTLEDSDIDIITEINKNVNSRVTQDELTENILWEPVSLEFSNMFSYSENNIIRFNKANGIVGVFAPNASGKSSLFDILSFCIYDKTARTFLAKNILNNQKKTFSSTFHFKIDTVDYYINRRGKYVKHSDNVKVDVDFWKEVNGIRTSLNGEHRRDTNNNIRKYLGSFEDFILTTLSLQGNNSLFIDKSQTEKKEILSQFIGVDIFDKLFQIAYDDNKDTSVLIRRFKQDDFTSKLASIDSELIDTQTKYDDINLKLKKAREFEEKFNKEIISLNGKIVNLKSDKGVSVDELKSKKTKMQEKLSSIQDDISKFHTKITDREILQIELGDIIDSYDEEELEKNVIKLNKVNKELLKLRNEKYKLELSIKSLEEKKEHLNSHEYNENCDVCMKNSKHVRENLPIITDKLNKEYVKYKSVVESINDIEKIHEHLNKSKTEWDILQESKTKEDKIDREISSFHSRLSTLETEEVKIQNSINEYQLMIDELINNHDIIEKNSKIRSKIVESRNNLAKVKGKIDELNNEVLSLNGILSALKRDKNLIEEKILEVKKLENQSRLYDHYLNALGKNGISYELIEKALPMIEGEVNNILSQIVEFGMQLEIDGKSINAYIVYNDQKWPIEMCSGMERFISGLAIRVALINVCNLPRPNFLVIDEGFGALDSENLQSLFLLFTYLKTQFDFVIIISHIDSMRDVVDDLIEIRKDNGFSSVKY